MSNPGKVLIIGEHPIKESIRNQFVQQECEITEVPRLTESVLQIPWRDIVVLSSADNDADAIRTIETTDKNYDYFCRTNNKHNLL